MEKRGHEKDPLPGATRKSIRTARRAIYRVGRRIECCNMRSDAEEVDESDAAVVSAGAQGAQLLGSIHVDCGHVECICESRGRYAKRLKAGSNEREYSQLLLASVPCWEESGDTSQLGVEVRGRSTTAPAMQ